MTLVVSLATILCVDCMYYVNVYAYVVIELIELLWQVFSS